MEILRTPEKCFAKIKAYPFKPNYTTIKTHDGSDLRIHHIDEGPRDGPILLCMHGQPVWSYLYARMIPFLNGGGIRVIAPDLPGYGKSDKPALRTDYTYQRQVDWMSSWLVKNDFKNLTFFGQDWGGLIGLRMVADHADRFDQVAIGNTGLPCNPDIPDAIVDEILAFRNSKQKISLFHMAKKLRSMRGFSSGDKHNSERMFAYWQKYTWDTINIPSGVIASMMMEKRNMLSLLLNLLMIKLGFGSSRLFASDLSHAYEAPYPNARFKMAVRAMPSQVPMIPDQSLEAQLKAWEFFSRFEKPFLCIGAGNDPVTNGFEKQFIKRVPGAKNQNHQTIGGGHFLQWTKAEKLSNILIQFMKKNG
ncbi:MAG: haloalkane dehalogenase [Pseudomonadota bacterium]|nr:haloalkane dehalogenase [Pseudomonadota bacterium]MED5310216.1 haloalkane dehalogenase [Pseudomonadota bacterium]